MTRFTATAVGHIELKQEQDGINGEVLVLAETEADGLRLELQKASEYDEQDVALAMDTTACVRNGAPVAMAA
ncbi:MAG: hypothetical protein H6716_16645 [Polyangiaceae bacterium]|nr:hypothetical protein [Polyangiaceae bacterium]